VDGRAHGHFALGVARNGGRVLTVGASRLQGAYASRSDPNGSERIAELADVSSHMRLWIVFTYKSIAFKARDAATTERVIFSCVYMGAPSVAKAAAKMNTDRSAAAKSESI